MSRPDFAPILLAFLMAERISTDAGGPKSENSKRLAESIAALDGSDPEKTLEALVEIGDPAVDALLAVVRTPPKDSFRKHQNAAKALGRIGTPKAEAALLGALKGEEGNLYIRRFVIRALGQIGSPKAREALASIYQNTSMDVWLRAEAVGVLGNFPSTDVVEILKEAFQDHHPQIHYQTGVALARMGTASTMEALLEDIQNHPACIRDHTVRDALIRSPSPRVIETLIVLLHKDEGDIRTWATQVLEASGKPIAPLMVEALADPDSRVRWQPVRFTGKLKPEGAAMSLVRMLEDGDWMVRNEAAVALVKLNEATAIQALIKILSSKNAGARQEAAWILGEM